MAKKTQKAKKAAKKAVKKSAKTIMKKAPAKSAAKRVAAKRAASKPAAKKAPAQTGLRSVSPVFTVNDARASIAWYTDKLGFVIKERWEHEGVVQGAQMTSGNVEIFVSQDDWKLGRDRVKGQGTRMHIATDELVDTLADRIKAHGGTLDQEPKDEWGLRFISVTDPDGYKLTFASSPKK